MSIQIGDILADRYRIEEILGQGGMAIVFKAVDNRLDRQVAIKVIRMDQEISPTLIKRFEREARALGQLSHPNIVRILDYGEHAGEPYIVMAYLGGGSLKEFLKTKAAVTWQEAVRMLIPISSALSYAHAHGIVHRDVKTGNILLTEAGEPMLSDFGIARILKGEETTAGSTTTLTSTGMVIGTPVYMSPEQALGQEVDGRSDVYSMGVVLYELVTGIVPFQGVTPMDTLTQKFKNSFTPPQKYNPDLPGQLVKIIAKSLAYDLNLRYPSMEEFTHDLEDCLEQADETGSNKIINRFSQFPMRIIGLVAMIGVAIALIFVLYNFRNSVFPPQKPVAAATNPSSSGSVALVAQINETYTPVFSTAINTPKPVKTKSPTKTMPVRTQSPPTATAIVYSPLAGCAHSRLHVGDWAFIDFGDTGNFIRKSADVHSSSNIVGNASPGETMEIIGGPKCSYQWILWEVVTAGGLHGWTPESDGKTFWLVPGSKWEACQGTLPSRLSLGGKAVVSTYPNAANKLRTEPKIGSTLVGSIQPGEVVQLLDKPACGSNIVWWKVATNNGSQGWTAEGIAPDYFLIPLLDQ